jgi:hypothetical protein
MNIFSLEIALAGVEEYGIAACESTLCECSGIGHIRSAVTVIWYLVEENPVNVHILGGACSGDIPVLVVCNVDLQSTQWFRARTNVVARDATVPSCCSL